MSRSGTTSRRNSLTAARSASISRSTTRLARRARRSSQLPRSFVQESDLPPLLPPLSFYYLCNSQQFLLSATEYVSPFWLPYRQASELGGHVRKGEENTSLIFWKVENSKQSGEDLEVEETNDKDRRRFLLRYYRVFNLEQCEVPHAVLDKLPKIETHQHDPIEAAERIIAKMPKPPEIQYAGSRAVYSPITDRIILPPRELFTSIEKLMATTYHEMSRASGHPKRPNRKSIIEPAPFGSPTYSLEEIVAEMSAAFLCAEAKISPAVIDNEAAYIQGWLAKLRSEKRLVVIAFAQA